MILMILQIFFGTSQIHQVVNMFSIMIVLDFAYQTYKYRLLLLEFVSDTSTELTFSITYALMMFKKEDNVIWALQWSRNLLKSKDISSKIVVIDQDNDLMNVFETIFLEATTLLCKYHIEKMLHQNVRQIAKLRISKAGLEK